MFEAAERVLRARFRSYEWTLVAHGMSDAATYRLQGRTPLYVKLGKDMVAEARRIDWLNSIGFPGPELYETGELDGVQWLVMTAVVGRVVFDPWPTYQRMRVIEAAAEMLKWLHALPVQDCPFDRTLDIALAEARERQPEKKNLHAVLQKTRPATEDLVVCHGDYCTPNMLIDPDTLQPTGLIDLGKLGRADRYADLALMRGSLRIDLNPQYGEEHVERFLAAYGADPADPRLEYYLRLDWLV